MDSLTTVLGSYLKAGVAMRHNAPDIAANHIRAALAAIDWDERACAVEDFGWSIYVDSSLDWMMAYVEAIEIDGDPGGRIVISEDTWETLAYDDEALDYFLEEMRAGGSGMKFIVQDVGPYARAVRAEAKAKGTDVVMAKDALTELGERAHALLIQAASLNASPTPVQRQTFAVRYAKIAADFAQLELRLGHLAAEIELAGTALFDTAAG